ncbi:MAG: tetratricopeptide repeat protein [Thermodesulfovibrionales bacterium]|nr:tetratricopeptide repeat protein [Thermodesulfovibrionales bacterium]MCL0085167.1 tetratricopeptide repeat protein [Thermodesulfovibrionales bacterium]
MENIRQKLKQRQRTIVLAAAIFVVLAALIAAFIIHHKVAVDRALELEFKAHKLFHGDPIADQIIPRPDRYRNALENFRESYEIKGRPHLLLYIANCYYELGYYDNAIKTLKKLNNRYSGHKIIPLSYFKMAMTYMRKDDPDGALGAFHGLIEIKDGVLHDMALLESGKILEYLGRTEEARNKYKELIDRFPQSVFLNEAKARLERI